jgi:hypothetical protein
MLPGPALQADDSKRASSPYPCPTVCSKNDCCQSLKTTASRRGRGGPGVHRGSSGRTSRFPQASRSRSIHPHALHFFRPVGLVGQGEVACAFLGGYVRCRLIQRALGGIGHACALRHCNDVRVVRRAGVSWNCTPSPDRGAAPALSLPAVICVWGGIFLSCPPSHPLPCVLHPTFGPLQPLSHEGHTGG